MSVSHPNLESEIWIGKKSHTLSLEVTQNLGIELSSPSNTGSENFWIYDTFIHYILCHFFHLVKYLDEYASRRMTAGPLNSRADSSSGGRTLPRF